MKKNLLTITFLTVLKLSFAQTTYTFLGNGNWNIPSNWSNNIIPPVHMNDGSVIYISPSTGDSCILYNTQVVSGGSSLIVSPGALFIVLGNLEINVLPKLKLLAALYEIDTAASSPLDTLLRRYFEYDTLNRPVCDSLKGSNPTSYYFLVNQFTYTGNDSFVYRRSYKNYSSNNPANITYDTTYYSFINGNYQRDTIIFDYPPPVPNGTARNIFIYSQDSIVRDFRNWIPDWSQSNASHQVIHQTKENGNIIHQIDTSYSFYNGSPSGSQIFQTYVTYLQNENPLYKITYPSQRSYYYRPGIGEMNFGQYYYVPKLLISQQISTFANITYEYQFDENGYPIIAYKTNIDPDTAAIKKTKLIFIYKD